MTFVLVRRHDELNDLPGVADCLYTVLYSQLLGGSAGDLIDKLGVLIESKVYDLLQCEFITRLLELPLHVILYNSIVVGIVVVLVVGIIVVLVVCILVVSVVGIIVVLVVCILVVSVVGIIVVSVVGIIVVLGVVTLPSTMRFYL